MIANIVAICFMLILSKKYDEIKLAALFLTLLEYMTALNDQYLVIYYNWQMFIYGLIAYLFANMALKSSFKSVYAYILYVSVYCSFALENTIYEFTSTMSYGFLDDDYKFIMHGCLVVMIIAVSHDRIDTIKNRVSVFLRKFSRSYH